MILSSPGLHVTAEPFLCLVQLQGWAWHGHGRPGIPAGPARKLLMQTAVEPTQKRLDLPHGYVLPLAKRVGHVLDATAASPGCH